MFQSCFQDQRLPTEFRRHPGFDEKEVEAYLHQVGLEIRVNIGP
jgi:hypothetical protein